MGGRQLSCLTPFLPEERRRHWQLLRVVLGPGDADVGSHHDSRQAQVWKLFVDIIVPGALTPAFLSLLPVISHSMVQRQQRCQQLLQRPCRRAARRQPAAASGRQQPCDRIQGSPGAGKRPQVRVQQAFITRASTTHACKRSAAIAASGPAPPKPRDRSPTS